MCQILACSESNPPKQALVDGNDMNKDGFGYAWLQDKQVHWNKGFSHDELTDEVIEDFFSKPFPKAIHFSSPRAPSRTRPWWLCRPACCSR